MGRGNESGEAKMKGGDRREVKRENLWKRGVWVKKKTEYIERETKV